MLYDLIAWGAPAGAGSPQPRFCTLEGVAKQNAPDIPYLVANEFICSRLGLLVGLPVPPGVVVRVDDGGVAYVSLRFGSQGEQPPPIDPVEFAKDHESLAAGVVAFDCWIGNRDRHDGNLAYSPGVQAPVIFDHGHALFGDAPGDGAAKLAGLMDDPIVVPEQCLPPVLPSAAGLNEWAERIAGVRDGLIDDLCKEVNAAGALADAKDVAAASAFLRHRKGKILDMIKASKHLFPKIDNWGLL